MLYPIQIISRPNAIKPFEKYKLEKNIQEKLFPHTNTSLRISKSVFIDFK